MAFNEWTIRPGCSLGHDHQLFPSSLTENPSRGDHRGSPGGDNRPLGPTGRGGRHRASPPAGRSRLGARGEGQGLRNIQIFFDLDAQIAVGHGHRGNADILAHTIVPVRSLTTTLAMTSGDTPTSRWQRSRPPGWIGGPPNGDPDGPGIERPGQISPGHKPVDGLSHLSAVVKSEFEGQEQFLLVLQTHRHLRSIIALLEMGSHRGMVLGHPPPAAPKHSTRPPRSDLGSGRRPDYPPHCKGCQEQRPPLQAFGISDGGYNHIDLASQPGKGR